MKNTKNTSITPPSAIHNPRSAIRNLLARHLPAPFARAALLAAALVMLVGGSRASADVITLTGGNAGEGFAPLSTVFAAQSFGAAAGAVQGVTFNTNTSAIAASGYWMIAGPNGGANFTQTTTDDTNLANVFTRGLVGGDPAGNLVVAISGLTPGVTYQFDAFIGTVGSPQSRSETLKIWDGATLLSGPDTFTNVGPASVGGVSPAYDVRQTFTAPPSGTVQAKIGVSSFPLLSGVAITYNPPGALYNITATAGTGGSISPSGVRSVAENSTPTYTITPGIGYDVADVVVDGTTHLGAVTTYTFDPVTAAHTIDATFVAVSPHTITASAGANGSISPTGGVSVDHRGSQAFTITPDSGYVVADVVVDGTTHLGSVTTHTFTNVQANHTIAATFMSNPVIILTGGDAGEGFAPMSAVHAAVSFNQTGVGPVQGVAFNTNASAVTMTGNNTTANGGANFTQPTTDDKNLAKVFTAGYYTGGSMTATVTGLTAGREYQLDSFIGVMGSDARTEYVQVFDGLTPLTANVQVVLTGGNPSPAYDVRQTFTAPSGGTVQVKYTGTYYPLVCGVAITYAATTATAPAITGITAGNGTLSVAFTAPVSDGGSAITNYKYSTDNGGTFTAVSPASTTSPILISGLTNGTTYQVKILAVNSVGVGTPSDAVSGTPASSTACDMVSFEAAGVSGTITPGSPNTVIVTLPPGTDVSALTPTVVVSQWATYAPTGPQDFTNSVTTPVPYTVTADDGTTQQVYQVTLVVLSPPPNDNFADAIALPGTSGIQTGTGNRYATRETGEPAIFGATHTVWFKWTAPSDGSYTIDTLGSTKVGGGEWDAVLGIYTGSAVGALTGLPDENPQDTDEEESVTFDVTAGTTYHIQAAGFEDQEASNIKLTCTFVSSATAPTAPTITGITPGNGTLSVAFTAPVSDGGSAITNYKYSTDNGGTFTAVSPASTTSPILISGLTNGTTYQVKILAVNSVGVGAASAAVSGTPAASGTSYGTWETTNGASGGANADSNHNGVSNGIEFFMGGTAASPATLPALVNTAGTWSWTIPYDPAALATYKFRVSDDLSGWTDIVPPDASITVLTTPDRIQFTLPAGTGKKFCQLVVITP